VQCLFKDVFKIAQDADFIIHETANHEDVYSYEYEDGPGPDEGSTILLGCRTMLGECYLAAIQPKGFFTKLRAQERESVCVCV